jgi:serine phosphatase RsbU (regulator of sigma subunit)
MRLRTQWIAAFLLLAVLPLGVITLFAYHSSSRALQRTAQIEASRLAREMEERMTSVTARLDQRLDLLERIPFPESAEARLAPGMKPDAALAARLLATLGDAADYFESFQFDPAPGRARAGGRVPAPGAPPVPPVVIHLPRFGPQPGGRPDVAAVIKPVIALIPEKDLARLGREAGRVREEIEMEVGAAAAGIARLIEAQIKEAARPRTQEDPETGEAPADAPVPPLPSLSLRKEFACELQRDGQPVGRLKARVSTERLLKEVLSRTRREMGEVPFVTDAQGTLFTLDPADLPRLQKVARLARSGQAAPVMRAEVEDGAAASGNGETARGTEAAAAGGPATGATGGGSAAVGSGDDQWVVVTHEDAGSGLVFGIARPVGDSLREIRRAAARNLAAGLGLAGLALFGILPISRRMTRNLAGLTQAAGRLAAGDLDTQVPVRSHDELGQLAVAFNRMARELSAQQQRLVEQERLRKELEMCRRIQSELLPKGPLSHPFAEVQGLSIPARELGGDFFNYFALPDGEVALLMGDVSGKGVPAALLMANLQATLAARLPLEPDLARFAADLDRSIDASTPSEVYLTLFLGVLDPLRRELRYVNAGHESPFLLRRDGRLERLDPTGRPIGLLTGGGYVERRVPIEPGDRLFLYTDGLVDAEDPSGADFGLARLESILDAGGGDTGDPATLLARVERAYQEHRGGAEAADDATLLLLKVGDPAILETAAGRAAPRPEPRA